MYILYVLINTVQDTVIKWSKDSAVKKCQKKLLAQVCCSLFLQLCPRRWLPLRANAHSPWHLPLSDPSASSWVTVTLASQGQSSKVITTSQPLIPLTLFSHVSPKLLAHKSQSNLPALLSKRGSHRKLAHHSGEKLAVDQVIFFHIHKHTVYQQVSHTLHLPPAQVSRG